MKRRTTKPAKQGVKTPDDPVVKEVRAVRAKVLKKGGGSVMGYFRVMDELTERRVSGARPTAKRRRSA